MKFNQKINVIHTILQNTNKKHKIKCDKRWIMAKDNIGIISKLWDVTKDKMWRNIKKKM